MYIREVVILVVGIVGVVLVPALVWASSGADRLRGGRPRRKG